MSLREYSTEKPPSTQPSTMPPTAINDFRRDTLECTDMTKRAEFGEKKKLANNTSNEGAIIKIYKVDKMWKKDLQAFCEQCKDDMPSIDNISHEADNWESFWLNHPKIKYHPLYQAQ